MVSIDEAIENVKKYKVQNKVNDKINELDIEKSIIYSIEKDLKDFQDKQVFIALGGLDSCLLLAIIKKHFPEYEIFTLTIGTRDSMDVKFSKHIMKKFKINHKIKIATHKNLEDSIHDCTRITKEIKNNMGPEFSLFLFYKILSKRTNKVIMGIGLDELTGEEPFYRDPRKYYFLKKPPNKRAMELLKKATENKIENISDENIVSAMRYVWKYELPKSLLYSKKYSKFFGINVRLPYLDEIFINTINKVAISKKIDSRELKKIIKNIAMKYLSPKIVYRDKRGLQRITSNLLSNKEV